MNNERAFTLVEVTLAIGIVAFALLAVLGLVPVALQAAKDAADDTKTSLIAQDVGNRLRAIPNLQVPAVSGTTWYYDTDGRWINPTNQSPQTTYSRAFYRVQASYGPMAPANLPPLTSGTLFVGAKADIGWPVNPQTGLVIGPAQNTARTTYSYGLHPQ